MNLTFIFRLLFVACFSITVISCSKDKKETAKEQVQPEKDLGSQFTSLIKVINEEPQASWTDKQLSDYKKSIDQLQKVYDKIVETNSKAEKTVFRLPKNTQSVIDNRMQMLEDAQASKSNP